MACLPSHRRPRRPPPRQRPASRLSRRPPASLPSGRSAASRLSTTSGTGPTRASESATTVANAGSVAGAATSNTDRPARRQQHLGGISDIQHQRCDLARGSRDRSQSSQATRHSRPAARTSPAISGPRTRASRPAAGRRTGAASPRRGRDGARAPAASRAASSAASARATTVVPQRRARPATATTRRGSTCAAAGAWSATDSAGSINQSTAAPTAVATSHAPLATPSRPGHRRVGAHHEPARGDRRQRRGGTKADFNPPPRHRDPRTRARRPGRGLPRAGACAARGEGERARLGSGPRLDRGTRRRGAEMRSGP